MSTLVHGRRYGGPTCFDVDAARQERAWRRSLEVRQARAELKRQIAEGELELYAAVLDAAELNPDATGIALAKLIAAAPAFGQVRTSKTLRNARLAPGRPLGSLGHLERLRLATEIRRQSPNPERPSGRSDASEDVRQSGPFRPRDTLRIPEAVR